MSQGLFTAASGIAANQAKIDVISDNIANINTIGFKSSQINFETVFSKKLSAGSAPTDSIGGMNPMEVGRGVAVGEIGRNFDNGSVQTTGRSTDLNIQGEGFFSVMNSSGEVFLSRAGNFSVDANGNLVNPDGMYVVGTDSVTSTTSGTTAVQVPTKLNFETPIAEAADLMTNIGQETGSTVTTGTFTIDFNGYTVPVGDSEKEIVSTDDITAVVANLNTAITDAITAGDLTGPCTASYDAGTGIISIDNSANPGETIDFSGDSSDTSNFLSVMGFTENAGTPGLYESEILKDHSQVTVNTTNATGVDTDNNYSITTFAIGNDGAIEATYSNGAKLTVETSGTSKALKYVSPSGREISNSGITNTANIDPAQLQLQLATVVNPKGLNAEGGNLFGLNSIAGDTTYAIGGAGGLGVINAGSLEASNVDLPSEFANMILAQRGVEASSRTFSVQDQIMRQIVNLGR